MGQQADTALLEATTVSAFNARTGLSVGRLVRGKGTAVQGSRFHSALGTKTIGNQLIPQVSGEAEEDGR